MRFKKQHADDTDSTDKHGHNFQLFTLNSKTIRAKSVQSVFSVCNSSLRALWLNEKPQRHKEIHEVRKGNPHQIRSICVFCVRFQLSEKHKITSV